MPDDNDIQPRMIDDARGEPEGPAGRRSDATAAARREIRNSAERVVEGLERIREILLGDVLAEIERRISRIDQLITSRTTELQHDARRRTDVLDVHVRKELDALSNLVATDSREVNDAIRTVARQHREANAVLEQRLGQLEDRFEGTLARIERDSRQQLLDQSNWFLNEIERVRQDLRSTLIRELGIDRVITEEGSEHEAGPWPAPH